MSSFPNFPGYSLANFPCPVLIYQRPSLVARRQKMAFQTPQPNVQDAVVSFPTKNIMLVTLNRPKSLNCINSTGNHELDALWKWLDDEPSLRVGIITGAGRAFCAGADLKEWDNNSSTPDARPMMPPSGFAGLSRRNGKKPVIAAVNGLCHGGGTEAIINCDIVIASASAQFALPEVKRGVVALAGALPRLVRTVGRQRAMEMALTGRTVGAEEAERWGLVNRVVEGEVVAEAVRVAEEIAGNSPDSVIVSREGVKAGWKGMGVQEATDSTLRDWYVRMDKGENMKEGLRAFVEKRKPRWVPSKL